MYRSKLYQLLLPKVCETFLFKQSEKSESAKLRATRALVPYVSRVSCALWLTCSCALRAFLFHVPRAYVFSCLTCSRALRASCPACSRVSCSSCQACPCAWRASCLTCLVPYMLLCLTCVVSYVLFYFICLMYCVFSSCSFLVSYVLLIPHLLLGVFSLTFSHIFHVS